MTNMNPKNTVQLVSLLALQYFVVSSADESCPKNEIIATGPYLQTNSELGDCIDNLKHVLNGVAEGHSELDEDGYVKYLETAYDSAVEDYPDLDSSLQRAYSISACNSTASCNDDSGIDLSVIYDSDSINDPFLFKVCGRIAYYWEISEEETPSSAPTSSPTAVPSILLFSGEATIQVKYALDSSAYFEPDDDSITANEIRTALINGMGTTIDDLLDTLGYSKGRRYLSLRHQRRKLYVEHKSNDISEFISNGCDETATNVFCYLVTHDVSLYLEDEKRDTVLDDIKSELENELSGTFLGNVKSESDFVVQIVKDHNERPFSVPAPNSAPVTSEAEAVDAGLISGIAVACAAVIFSIGYVAIRRKRRLQLELDEEEFENPLGAAPSSGNGLTEQDVKFMLHGDVKKNSLRFVHMDSVADSDSAGGSGWSSQSPSPRMSPIKSASPYQGNHRQNKDFRNTLAAVAVASGIGAKRSKENYGSYNTGLPSSYEDDDSMSESSSIVLRKMSGVAAMSARSDNFGDNINSTNSGTMVTKKDLDVAIDAQDWAAVGATAALLAHQKQDDDDDDNVTDSTPSQSGTNQSRKRSGLTPTERARAQEMDHLVDTGDWEAVVLTAAKYESAQPVDDDSTSNLNHINDASISMGGSSSVFTSEKKRRVEIRQEVAELVHRVVPDESDNIDEMMHQFHGREEELLETLRSMQERAIAQRQRLAAQRKARLDATAAAVPPPPAQLKYSLSRMQSLETLDHDLGDISGIAAGYEGSKDLHQESTDLLPASTLTSDASIQIANNNTSKHDQLHEEERQAMAEAEHWEAIAEDSRGDNDDSSATNKSAVAATDWAIARSLQTLEENEKDAADVGNVGGSKTTKNADIIATHIEEEDEV